MLTKTDLSQIQKIVHTEVQTETKKVVREETPAIVQKIVQSELKPIKHDITKIKKDINLIVHSFDRDYVTLRRTVEEHIMQHSYPAAS